MKKCAIMAMLIMMFCSVAFGQIKVSDKVDEHAPVIVEAQTEASLYFWTITKTSQLLDPVNHPTPAFSVEVDDGKALHIWAEPGRYLINLNMVTIDWDAKTLKKDKATANFEIVARGKPEPKPDDPDDPDVPVPTAFKAKVSQGLTKVEAAFLTHKDAVAATYKTIAVEAKSSPNAWDAATMVNEAKVRNATALPTAALKGWSGFWPELASAFKSLELSPEDLDGHIKAFEDVAEVLKQ